MDLFTNRPPTPDQATFLDYITATMLDAAGVLMQLPPSRFRSLAMTKLEEVSMWAKKACVFTYGVEPGPEDQDPTSPDLEGAAARWGAYRASREVGVTLPGRVGNPADAPVNVRPHRPGSLDQINPAPEDVDGLGYPKP